ncbi:MAG: VOC family protein [Methanomassiliicoccales archaeon]|nr:VOC family protein [Methanomassiliicoccales archaeon]
MPTRYAHTNIVAADWMKLAAFYVDVFDCEMVPPNRDMSGEWLEIGTGVKNAHLRGAHLKLPGYGEGGPTIEVFSYDEMLERPTPPAANRKGFGHLAFEVDDVDAIVRQVVRHGGKMLGRVSTTKVADVGTLTFAYTTDPEGNIVEVLRWDRG